MQEDVLQEIVNPELTAYASRYQSEDNRLKRGENALGIQLDDLSGRTLSLEKLKGNVVLLNFWSTGCLPCRKEIPEIAELAGDFKNQDFKIVTICLSHDKVQWNELVQDYPVNVISLITDRKQAAKLFEDYKIDGIPRFVLIDKYSMIADPYAPRPSDSSLKEAIEELLR
ncbi:MAG: TlpA family protein disulfide reductase [Bacteroidales bacterium]|nr:TlpA family protein disulfide reductase [Bacteroidales bacterium]